MSKVATYLICSMVLLLIIINLTHQILIQRNPQLASRYLPFDVSGGQAHLKERLTSHRPASNLQEEKALAESLIQRAPISARNYSLRATVEHMSGNHSAGLDFDNLALELNPADFVSLINRISLNISENRLTAAFSDFEILFRRNRRNAAALVRLMINVLETKQGIQEIAGLLAKDPSWSSYFYRELGRTKRGALIAYKIQFELLQHGYFSTSALIQNIDILVLREMYDLAHRLRTKLITKSDSQLNGIVYNSKFERQPSGTSFEWRLKDRRGSSVRWLKDPTERPDIKAKGPAIQIQFHTQPVKQVGLSQMVMLPPGKYVLSTVISTRRAHLPKGLRWNLFCIAPNRSDVVLEIDPGDYSERNFETEFEISKKCDAHVLWLDTLLKSNTFLHKYSGEILVHQVEIQRLNY